MSKPEGGHSSGISLGDTEVPTGPYAGKVASHQTGTAAAHASANPRTGKVAEAGRHRLLQLSRSADKRSDTDRVSLPRHQPMATHATAAKSEGLDDQGTDHAVGQRLAPKTANPSPLARCALCSQTPKAGAVCPNWARTALCGGREVTHVPTAIQDPSGTSRSLSSVTSNVTRPGAFSTTSFGGCVTRAASSALAVCVTAASSGWRRSDCPSR